MNAEELGTRLGALLRGEVAGLRHLSGGTSRETWSFDLLDGRGTRPLVVQLVRSRLPRLPVETEAALLVRARAAGVPAAEVVAVSGDATALGHPFLVLERVAGETIARHILRDDAFAAVRPALVGQIAQAMARLHRLPADTVPGLPAEDQLASWRATFDSLAEAHPAFELGFRRLERNRPTPRPQRVVHGDFRLGNLVVGAAGLAAVLDWELAHAGDPVEDLGWLCVRAWRFGRRPPVAGLGGYAELLEAYARAGGGRVDPADLLWWETLGTVKWGVICILQSRRHLGGEERSVELATIGRRVCENEWDLLDCLDRAAELVHG